MASFLDKARPVAQATSTPSFVGKARPKTVSPTIPEKTPGLLSKLGTRFKNAGSAIVDEPLNVNRAILRSSGAVAGGINDVLGAVIDPIIDKTTQAIASVQAVQRFAASKPVSGALDAVNTGINKTVGAGKAAMSALPDKTQQDIRDATNVATVLPLGKGAQIAARASEPVTKPVLTAAKNAVVSTPDDIVAKRALEIANIENNYASTRKANLYSKDAGAASRTRVAYTDVLVDAVDENGLLRTKQPGGAYEKYKAQTIDGREGVVRTLLEKEGKTIPLSAVEQKLTNAVLASNLEGEALREALNSVKREVAGYRLKADAAGNVPLTLIHDAKISTTQGINFLTEPNVKVSKKTIARGLKEIVEENSAENVRQINAELSKYYDDLDLIERLDGKRVKGGKLGKFASQAGGAIVGTGVGAAFGGPLGAALGGYLGSEVATKLKGRALSKTLGKPTGLTAPESEILKDAYERSLKDSTSL